MDITIKEFNTYQNFSIKNGYEKILCPFCYSDILPIEKDEKISSVKCIYCNTVMTISDDIKNEISRFIKSIIDH